VIESNGSAGRLKIAADAQQRAMNASIVAAP
jgi:hypothetical protein